MSSTIPLYVHAILPLAHSFSRHPTMPPTLHPSPKMTLQYTTILALISIGTHRLSLSGHSHNQLVFGKTVHSRASWCKIQNRKLKMRIDKLAVNLKSVARAVYRFMPCHAMPCQHHRSRHSSLMCSSFCSTGKKYYN